MMPYSDTTFGDAEGQASDEVVLLLESVAVALDISVDYFFAQRRRETARFLGVSSFSRQGAGSLGEQCVKMLDKQLQWMHQRTSSDVVLSCGPTVATRPSFRTSSRRLSIGILG